MNQLTLAAYALRRQRLAVERTLGASSMEESLSAAQWAEAWHRLVQRMLDREEMRALRPIRIVSQPASPTLH